MRLVTGMSVILAACAGTDASHGLAVRDSAGVTIAESTSPAWSGGDGWRLAAEPELQIGVVGGDPHYQFDVISGARFLSDGSIAVVDYGTYSLRIFGPDGGFIREFGRDGRGPGEFLLAADVRVARGDTVIVVDGRAPRITRFTVDGGLVDAVRIQMPGSARMGSVRPLADGRLLIGSSFNSRLLGERTEPGLYRLATPLLRFGTDGLLQDTLGMFPGTEIEVAQTERGFTIGPPWFGRDLSVDVRDDDVWIGTGDLLEIRLYTVDGSLRRIARVPGADLAFTAADLKRLRDRAIAGSEPGQRAGLDRFFAEERFPERRAAYSWILADDEGDVWTSPSGTPTLPFGSWNVFGPDGRWLGEFEFPEPFRVRDVRNSRVLGSWKDEYDVEYLRVYRIMKD